MKRFSDTQRIDETWYCEMTLEQRALYEFIWAKADHAGVWSVNLRLAEYYVGKKLNWQAFITACEGRVIVMTNNRVRLRGFIETNYGKLSRGCPPHGIVFKTLEKHGMDEQGNEISPNPTATVASALPTPVGIILDQEEEEDQDKDKTTPARENKARGTLDELKAFAVEIGHPENDGEACFHKWQGNGWTNNGVKIKDWRATIRAWKASGYLPSQKAYGGGNGAAAKAARTAGQYPENIQAPDITPDFTSP